MGCFGRSQVGWRREGSQGMGPPRGPREIGRSAEEHGRVYHIIIWLAIGFLGYLLSILTP